MLRTICAIAMLLAGSAAMAQADTASIEHRAHDGYVAAINSNDLDTFTAFLTDDVVFQAPGSPQIVGKAAVRQWAAGYLGAYRTS